MTETQILSRIEAQNPIQNRPGLPRFGYRIAGLFVLSDVELPSAATALHDLAGVPDVSIAAAVLPAHLQNPHGSGPDWEAQGDAFLLRVPGVARFLMVAGATIRYDPDPAHQGDDLPLFFLGTCLAVIQQQRGLMVFHGSAVVVRGLAMLFCGASGAGKSTLAARLCQAGYPLLADDVCSLAQHPVQGMVVDTDGRMLKLWRPAIRHLALEGQRGAAVQKSAEKFYLRPPATEQTTQRLGAVFLLESGPEETAATLERLSAVQSMEGLRRNSYRPALVEAMGLETAFFNGCAALQRQAPVYRLRRPMQFCRLEESVALLEAHWSEQSR